MMTVRIRLLASLLMALCCAAHAQPQVPTAPFYTKPEFREDLFGAPRGGQELPLKSPQPDGSNVSVPARLYKPAGQARGAVVVMNAANGWTDSREGNYGRALSSAGYAVLLVDSYSPRLISTTQHDNAKLSLQAQGRDAQAARRQLVDMGYPEDRIAVMGSGRGGMIALLVSDRAFSRDEGGNFALAIAITPGCFLHPHLPAAKVFLALAERDDLSGARQCQELASDYASAGARIQTRVYVNATSGFDGPKTVLRLQRDEFVETFNNCKVLVEGDGRLRFQGNSYDEAGFGTLIAQMRKSCMQHGGLVGTNLTQKANLTLDIIEFLDSNFRR